MILADVKTTSDIKAVLKQKCLIDSSKNIINATQTLCSIYRLFLNEVDFNTDKHVELTNNIETVRLEAQTLANRQLNKAEYARLSDLWVQLRNAVNDLMELYLTCVNFGDLALNPEVQANHDKLVALRIQLIEADVGFLAGF